MMAKFITPGTRRFIRITSAEAEEMEKWFDLFMGNDVAPRKQYIEAHGHEFMDELDIS
jgi:DNA gyrase subunit B